MLTKDDKDLLKLFAEKILQYVNNENYPRCELAMEGKNMFFVTDKLLPENYNVTVYRYVNRRQKHTSNSGGTREKSHVRVKGWRFAGNLRVANSSPAILREGMSTTPWDVPTYKYKYALMYNGDSLLKQAREHYNTSNLSIKADYFRQRLAIEIADEFHNPLTPKLEFMMDYSKSGTNPIAENHVWFCRVHQITSTP